MNFKKRLLATMAASAALISISAAPASADVVSYSASIGLTNTNWSDALSVHLFDASLGTLQSITFTLTGDVAGTAQVESTDTSPSTVTSALSAQITLQRPDSSTIVITSPTATSVDNFSAYDGTTDFGGTSGATHTMLTNNLSQTVTSTSIADFALFTGLGDLLLPIFAVGTSSATGAGNLLTSFNTAADATLDITYTYLVNQDTGVPEPATLALVGFGLLSSLAVARRRRGE